MGPVTIPYSNDKALKNTSKFGQKYRTPEPRRIKFYVDCRECMMILDFPLNLSSYGSFLCNLLEGTVADESRTDGLEIPYSS